MTGEEAKLQVIQFIENERAICPDGVAAQWDPDTLPGAQDFRAQAWIVECRNNPRELALVRGDTGVAYALYGGIATVFFSGGFESVGLPCSNELWLGSGPGRYQQFDNGLILWESGPDHAYVAARDINFKSKQRCQAIVAFTDLRGFTKWSERNPDRVQGLIMRLETSLQRALQRLRVSSPFLKGVGDGMMMVSEAASPSLGYSQGQILSFVSACAVFLKYNRALSRTEPELAVGCGIDTGELNRVFVLGRRDYLGESANNAANLQQLAWNEICVSEQVLGLIAKEGSIGEEVASRAVKLADRGFRLSMDLFRHVDDSDGSLGAPLA